jgi:hypothetical protein
MNINTNFTEFKSLREEYLLYNKIPYKVMQVLKETTNCHIAGGAVASVFSSKPIKDYDIYVDSFVKPSTIDTLYQELKNLNGVEVGSDGYCLSICTTFETDNSYSLNIDGSNYQLIRIYNNLTDIRSILLKFDFTVCMMSYRPVSGTFVINNDALTHLSQRRLVVNTEADYPIASLYRVKKYIDKGFTISGVELLKLGLMIQKLEINSLADFRKQMTGIDTLFLKDLIDKLLKEEEEASKKYDFNLAMELINAELIKKWGDSNE